MREETSDSDSMVVETLPSLPAEAVYIILAGGLGSLVTIIGTILFDKHKTGIENKRMRKALYTEINMINAKKVDETVSEMLSDEMKGKSMMDLIWDERLDEFAGDKPRDFDDGTPDDKNEERFASVIEMLGDSLRRKYLGHSFEHNLAITTGAMVYEKNLDKIGTLNTDQIEAVQCFHAAWNGVEDGMRRVNAVSIEGGASDDWSYIHDDYQRELVRLQSLTKDFVKWRSIALDELDEDDEWEERFAGSNLEEEEDIGDETSADARRNPGEERAESDLETEEN